MTFDDPALLDLRGLFRDRDMFDSRSSWAAAGFSVNRSSNGKIMVTSHSSVRGLLFKKYTDDVSSRMQRENYECRLRGSRRLRDFIVACGLTRVVVPRKWILELPRELSRRGTILVVEELDLLGHEQTVTAYRHIDVELLRQLCTVLYAFRGMDSNAKNLPFLADGRIGLVDTEHWDRGSSKDYLHHVREHMSEEGRKVAKKIFRQLRDDRSTLRELIVGDGGGRTNVDSGAQDDFPNEETSDSSSASSTSS
jgi:hypothetical protein